MFSSDTAAAEIVAELNLQPLPDEGGFWAPGVRLGEMNCIYFLMTGAADGFSALHRLEVTEGWQWLAGAPARMVQLSETTGLSELSLSSEDAQTIVPVGVWQGARTLGDWTLVSCWCAPAFTEEIFELAMPEDLISRWPEHAAVIREFTR